MLFHLNRTLDYKQWALTTKPTILPLGVFFFLIKWQNFKRRLLTHIHMEKLEFGLVWEVCSNQCDLCCGLFWEAFPFAQKVVWVDAFFPNKGQLMECLMRSPLIHISGHCKSAKHQTPTVFNETLRITSRQRSPENNTAVGLRCAKATRHYNCPRLYRQKRYQTTLNKHFYINKMVCSYKVWLLKNICLSR